MKLALTIQDTTQYGNYSSFYEGMIPEPQKPVNVYLLQEGYKTPKETKHKNAAEAYQVIKPHLQHLAFDRFVDHTAKLVLINDIIPLFTFLSIHANPFPKDELVTLYDLKNGNIAAMTETDGLFMTLWKTPNNAQSYLIAVGHQIVLNKVVIPSLTYPATKAAIATLTQWPTTTIINNTPHPCTCTSHTLFLRGCQCGGC